MNSPTEGKNNGGGGGKEIDSNEEEGNLSGTNKQQINIGEEEKANETKEEVRERPSGSQDLVRHEVTDLEEHPKHNEDKPTPKEE